MKIYDHENDQILESITLFLTPDEARELGGAARDLANNPDKHHHHVSDSAYTTEITVAVYTQENLHQFNAKARVILGNESV